MTQMLLLWWPTSSAAKSGGESGSKNTTTDNETASSSANCSCGGRLRKLMRKVKRQGKAMLRAAGAGRRKSSFQCRYEYDPLSYSLNFDSRNNIDDQDYYQFCAFSSRFALAAANPRKSSCSEPADEIDSHHNR